MKINFDKCLLRLCLADNDAVFTRLSIMEHFNVTGMIIVEVAHDHSINVMDRKTQLRQLLVQNER